MKKDSLFIAVMIVLVAHDMEVRAKNWRKTAQNARYAFWSKYEDAVFRILDELEARNIYRQENHGSNKP